MSDIWDIEVTRHETIPVGHSSYYGSQLPTGTLVRVTGEWFIEIDSVLYTTCRRCDLRHPGYIEAVAHVASGVCFWCAGRGYNRALGSLDEAVKIARRRQTDRARAERKRQAKRTEQAKAHAAWQAANPDLAADLAAIHTELSELEGIYGDDAFDAWEARNNLFDQWGMFIVELAAQAQHRPLSENQTAAVAKAIADTKARILSDQQRQDASRWLGAEGDKVTVAGTVTTAKTIEVKSHTGFGTAFKRLVIVDGTGGHAGVTIKAFGTGASLYQVERGQTVTITGTVKGHGEYEDIKQTEITRAKVTDRKLAEQ